MTEPVFYDSSHCNIEYLRSHINQKRAQSSVRYSHDTQSGIPIYDTQSLKTMLSGNTRQPIVEEWVKILAQGPGVILLRGLVEDTTVVDEATQVFETMIGMERESSAGEGDHFAPEGNNTRLWNSTQKLCLADPELFIQYFGNPTLAAICEAWLGPGYQMTSQVNVVHPGGKAQNAHRDYHLGFQSTEQLHHYASHIHAFTPALTLQGAIAHCTMPLESGPTRLLPFSQSFGAGYLAVRTPAFRDFFEQHCIQLPLEKGDGLFFNPAVFHASGANTSPYIERMANLLQISSPFGRAMESLDRTKMVLALYPALLKAKNDLSVDCIQAAVAACAESYSFPTNLDTDPPIDGQAPLSQSDLVHRALQDNHSVATLTSALVRQIKYRR